jgi:hypothetical protein
MFLASYYTKLITYEVKGEKLTPKIRRKLLIIHYLKMLSFILFLAFGLAAIA